MPFLTSIPLELLLKIASFLDPLTVLTLIHTTPRFSGLFSVFTRQYHREQDVAGCSYTPLQYFIVRGIDRAVAHILSIGADPNATASINPKFQKPPLIHAVRFGRASTVSLLLQHGARVDERGYRACSNLDDGPTPDDGATRERISLTALHTASWRQVESESAAMEQREIIQLLLRAGADMEARTHGQHTALHLACGRRNPDLTVVAALIAAGANVHSKTEGGRADFGAQPIHFAAMVGNTAVVRLLLNAGVDVQAITHDGLRVLDVARLAGRADTMALLVEVGADISIAGSPGAVDSGVTNDERSSST